MNFRFCSDRNKKFTTWQIVNLEIKIQDKPVKAVSYIIGTAKLQSTTVLTYHMIQYVHSTLLTLYTQPKYRDLSTNYRTDVEHFCENSIYHYPYIFYYKYRDQSLVRNHYGSMEDRLPFHP